MLGVGYQHHLGIELVFREHPFLHEIQCRAHNSIEGSPKEIVMEVNPWLYGLLLAHTISPTSTSSGTIGGASSPSSSSSLGPGAIAGIVIDSVAILAIVIFATYFLARRRKPRSPPPHELHSQHNPKLYEKDVYPAELENRQIGNKVAELPVVQSP
ncbi:hypothetical protein T440DRAFT_478356 [Plenodomus tracheiphilus IPT5]|uniref:Uncharacterized protein n=1 Tax=Plenodomus tracheiphilus IPT5 TaxID=1408161 RepID=A0A6A7BBX8_9PLEO|nr:hypothetical protein T440DRAFT_478356 [Plenodomus tracheiphilus IPT5]